MSDGHEWVDLGLSVKWATCNIGAASSEEFGQYFAWGEISPKNEYDWSNYRYRISGNKYADLIFSKYNTNSDHGAVDNKECLEPADDAAKQNWGDSWRMPTSKEWSELVEKCTWTWCVRKGHYGYEVKSKKNGNIIFLPAAGSRISDALSGTDENGYYWSSILDDNLHSTHAKSVNFSSLGIGRTDIPRYDGCSIRPVTE